MSRNRAITAWPLLRLVSCGLAYAAWLALATWRLRSVPGLDLDEAWYILSARGEWPPADPLSGMTRYTGPFPVLLLKLMAGRGEWLLLRGVGVACNALTLVLLARWLRRRYPTEATFGWAVPLLGTVPVWLIHSRSGIEPTMFLPLLGVLGTYLVTLGTRSATFVAGLAWGIGAYNHVLGAFIPIGIALAWLIVYRGLPALYWRYLGAGLLLGVAPRLLALMLFRNVPIGGAAATWRFARALRDLPSLPGALWGVLGGPLPYLRYVGETRFPVVPYWLLALGFLVPWITKPNAIPKGVRVVLLAGPISATLVTIFAPKIGCFYLLAPIIAITLGVVELGAAAVMHDRKWLPFVRTIGVVIASANLCYFVGNYLTPWQGEHLPIARFAMGKRNPAESNYPYLPRERLVSALRELAPEQVLATPTLERPLRVLLARDPIQVRLPSAMEPGLRTVFVGYHEGEQAPERCTPEPAKACFSNPKDVDGEYLIYRQ